jgi:hypothetical protein
MIEEQTEAEIQAMLAKGPTRGPRTFKGRTLAAYSHGLRDLLLKVVRNDDTIYFHDFAMVYILMEAHYENPEDKIPNRKALIAATDDVANFRAMLSAGFIDDLSEEEISELRTLVNDILEEVELSQVTLASQKKSSQAASE